MASPGRVLELAGLARGVKVLGVKEQQKGTPGKRRSIHKGKVAGCGRNAVRSGKETDHEEP